MDIANKINEIGLKMNADNASLREALLEQTVVEVTDEQLPAGINRLIYNHTLTKTSLGEEVFRTSKSTYLKRIAEAVEQGIIAEPIYHNRSHLFTLSQVHQLIAHYQLFPRYQDLYHPKVISIQNYKGGTGKSTTTVSLAMATALDLELNARVCVIDLDPQGSAARGIIQVADEANELFITAADLLCVELEPEGEVAQLMANNDFADIVQAALFSTHIPNLDVMTAFPTDEKFTDFYWELSDQQQRAKFLMQLKTKILPILKEHYDVIYLDLPPQNSPITWSATEAAEMILCPITPRSYDFASTTSYMLTLGELIKALPSAGKNIEFFKLLPVNYSDNNKHERKTFDRLLRTVGNDLFVTPIKHSPLFLEAATMNRTIFDLRKTESTCTALQYEAAHHSVKEVYRNLINELKIVAAK